VNQQNESSCNAFPTRSILTKQGSFTKRNPNTDEEIISKILSIFPSPSRMSKTHSTNTFSHFLLRIIYDIL